MTVKLINCYQKIKAIRITRENFEDLKVMETGFGVLADAKIEDVEGEWFIDAEGGFQLMPGWVKLFHAEKLKAIK